MPPIDLTKKTLKFGVKLGASVFALGIVIAIVGISTNSAPIAVGVVAGVTVAIFAFVVIFEAKAQLKRDLDGHAKTVRPPSRDSHDGVN